MINLSMNRSSNFSNIFDRKINLSAHLDHQRETTRTKICCFLTPEQVLFQFFLSVNASEPE